MRPEGYGTYRHAGWLYGFSPEYHRGTRSAREYRKRLAASYACWASARYEQDYDGFSTILVVTADYGAEERSARAAAEARVGRGPALPLLVTCRWRIEARQNPQGLLGPIWREPASPERRSWPPNAHPASPPGRPGPAGPSSDRRASGALAQAARAEPGALRERGRSLRARGPHPRPGLLIRRIFQPDPDRAAAALAELLGIQPAGPVSQPAGDSGIAGVPEFPGADGPRPRRWRGGHQQRYDRRPDPADGRARPPRPGRTPAWQG